MAADGGGEDTFFTGDAFCADSETLPVSKNIAIKPMNARWAGVEEVVRFIKIGKICKNNRQICCESSTGNYAYCAASFTHSISVPNFLMMGDIGSFYDARRYHH